MMKKTLGAILLAGAALYVGGANAAVTVLNFEGAGNLANLNDFYNGGTDSLGNSGVNYGIKFGSNTLSLVDRDAGGNGNFANEPSPNTVIFFLTGTAVLNYAPGFTTGFSFYYSSSTAASVFVYDDLNATGNLLAQINLLAQGFDNCSGDPTGDFCNWTPIGVSFAGTAKSIDFGGTVNQSGYDNITFGSSTPGTGTVPEPMSAALVGLGLGAALLNLRRKV
jgi:hypothetical protein